MRRHGQPGDTYRVDVVPGGDGMFQVKGAGDHDGRWAMFLDVTNDAGFLKIHGFRITALWNKAFLTSDGGRLSEAEVQTNRDLIARALVSLAGKLKRGQVPSLDGGAELEP